MDQKTAKRLFGNNVVKKVLDGQPVVVNITTPLGTFPVLLEEEPGEYAGSWSTPSTIKVTVVNG